MNSTHYPPTRKLQQRITKFYSSGQEQSAKYLGKRKGKGIWNCGRLEDRI